MAPKPQGNSKQIDPDVQIPAAVKRAAEEANRLQAQQTPQPEPLADPAAQPPAPANDTIKIVEAQPPAHLGTTTVSDNPQPQPQPPTPVTPQGNGDDDQTWEQRYKTMLGRLNKAQSQIVDLQRRNDDLEALASSFRAPPAAAPAPLTAEQQQLLTKEEIDSFGPEMIDVMGRRAREAVTPEIAALRNQIATLEAQLQGTSQRIEINTRKGLYETLDRDLPLWREINNKDEFKIWLGLSDAYTGAKRHSLLMQAFEENNATRVLAFFKGFLAEEAALGPVEQVIAPSPAPTAVQPKPSLDQFAAPGRAKTSAGGNAPDEKPIITTADINNFYAAKRRGLYAGKEDEANRLEAMIFEAQREGRIRAT